MASSTATPSNATLQFTVATRAAGNSGVSSVVEDMWLVSCMDSEAGLAAEQAMGPEHQHQQQDHEADGVAELRPDEGSDQAFDDTQDAACDEGATHVPHAAHDDH